MVLQFHAFQLNNALHGTEDSVIYFFMFSTICYIISIICFITTFGCHATLKNGNPTDYPGYMLSPLLSSIPYISGFILAVIPECLVFDIAWYWMFLINIFIVIILGPIITKFYLVRMVSGKGLGVDAFISLLIAIVFLILGIIFQP